MCGGGWNKYIIHKSMIDVCAVGMRERHECTIREMAISPEIHCGSITVLTNKFGADHTNMGQRTVLNIGFNKGGAGGKK
jgi:hypothetical protein